MNCSDKRELVKLSEYVNHYGCSLQGIKRRCQNGEMQTAVKCGKTWMVDINEEPPADKRLVHGHFVNWRKITK